MILLYHFPAVQKRSIAISGDNYLTDIAFAALYSLKFSATYECQISFVISIRSSAVDLPFGQIHIVRRRQIHTGVFRQDPHI